jgi:uncharacterized membrane protein YedE/YeeE
MNENFSAALSGLLFGLGLCISGMADPSIVLGFLDFAGAWNPALIFVMGGGVVTTFIGYRIVFGLRRPIFAEKFSLPTATDIDLPLIAGAAIFGIGWGLAGYCPGPALTSLASGRGEVILFVAAMVTGMIAVRWIRSRPANAPLTGRA